VALSRSGGTFVEKKDLKLIAEGGQRTSGTLSLY
jgi:hypothetical protein